MPRSFRRRAELRADDKGEHKELMAIYVGRGLDPSLTEQVANQLVAHDTIGAHARDEAPRADWREQNAYTLGVQAYPMLTRGRICPTRGGSEPKLLIRHRRHGGQPLAPSSSLWRTNRRWLSSLVGRSE